MEGYVNAIHIASMPRKSPRSHAFGGTGRQHDSSEFLMYLVGVLHDEMNKNRDKPDYLEQTMSIVKSETRDLSQKEKDDYYNKATDLMDTRDAIRQEWRRKLAGDDSEFSNLFHGMEVQLIRCTREDCGYLKKSWREFSVLQMLFPPKFTMRGSKHPSVSLSDVLKYSFNVETPDPLGEYKCTNCKTANTCVQDRAVTYLPDYLILEFSRFAANQYEPGKTQNQSFSAEKIRTQITFAENINLKQIFIPVDSPSSLPGDDDAVRGCVEPFIYDCYGIIMHLGSGIQSGHYYALTRNLDMPGTPQGKWHEFNDELVREQPFSFSQMHDKHVTHIFLKRRKN